MNKQDQNPSWEDMLVEETMRRFREECAKLPAPPPGYFYAPELKDVRFEGARCVVDMAIKLQQIIRSANEHLP